MPHLLADIGAAAMPRKVQSGRKFLGYGRNSESSVRSLRRGPIAKVPFGFACNLGSAEVRPMDPGAPKSPLKPAVCHRRRRRISVGPPPADPSVGGGLYLPWDRQR